MLLVTVVPTLNKILSYLILSYMTICVYHVVYHDYHVIDIISVLVVYDVSVFILSDISVPILHNLSVHIT